MKRCACCKIEQPVSEFYVARGRCDGRQPYCKSCLREKVAVAREKRIDHYRAKARAYGRSHALERRRNMARWRARNPERAREIYLAWLGRNRLAEAARKRARQGVFDDPEYTLILAGDPCCYCGGPGGTIDHITPMVAGGDGAWTNLTAACKPCNSSKWANSLLYFLAGKRH